MHMHVIQAWKESLTILKPKNFKLFFLVTIKTLIETLKTWTSHFWWLVVLYIMLSVANTYATPSQSVNYIINYVVVIFMVWTLFITVRPSIRKKTYSYYLSYNWHAVWFIIATTLLSILFQPRSDWVRVTLALVGIPRYIFYIFSLLDARASLADIWDAEVRSLKLTFYLYPLVLLICSFYWFMATVLDTCLLGFFNENLSPMANVIFEVVYLLAQGLLFCFLLCCISNLYIKQVHEHGARYF
jgi:hypothetical protein